MPKLTNRLKLSLPVGNDYVNREALNKIFEDIDKIVMLQGDIDAAKLEINENITKKVAKSGDTMTGNLTLDGSTGERSLVYKVGTGANDLIAMRNVLATNTFSLRDYRLGMDIWSWKDNTFTLHIANTNLLKKTGDTMIGTLNMDATTSERNLTWKTSVGDMGLRGKSDGVFSFRDWVKGIDVWSWDGTIFNVSTNTNLLKKTGDTMTGNLNYDTTTEKRIAAVDSTNKLLHGMVLRDNLMQYYDFLKSKSIFSYDLANELFYVTANTNLLKKAGDTMSGDLSINKAGATTKKLAFQKDGVETFNFYNFSDTHVGLRDVKNNKNVWEYNTATGSFDIITGINTNLLRKTGDTMTGNLGLDRASGERSLVWYKGGAETTKLADNDTRTMLYSTEGNEIVWTYEKASKTFEVRTPTFKFEERKVLTTSDLEDGIPSRSGKDDNGIYTIYEESNKNGKFSKKSILSSPDADGNYLIRTVTYYEDGKVYKTEIFDLKYDEDGDFVKAVPR